MNGSDAFDSVLERLVKSEAENGVLRHEKDKAQDDAREAQRVCEGARAAERRMRTQLSEIEVVKRDIHKLLVEVKSRIGELQDVGDLPWRLDQAIINTDEIPF